MAGSTERVKEIFAEAMRQRRDRRSEFLERACAGDAALRAQIDLLIEATDDAAAAGFLARPTAEMPPLAAAATVQSSSLHEGPGTVIGPYKLLQLIGEGGFGEVFMAEQSQPVQRRVALKIIKAGMDTKQVIARFEQERQALALMDHPHIAKVLDAGATKTGRPYFVMELVKGEPITDFCDRNNLSITDRLELFAQVCHAVQHAHHKGIIHRDIKPTNVLVHAQDGKPFAKVIDFGIAKATAARLTEKTLFTEHRTLIGTPEYMSPEQAEGSLDIDTRTDVYSLGVLLYELLTGATPFDSEKLRSAAFGEMQRIIREVDPPHPSTRLSQNADTLANVAARRHTEPRRLSSIIRGELDWIVMKALEKDRARRYETANGLAADVARYLAGEPVVAAPPSAAYRFTKFVRRHRGKVAAAAVIATTLLLAAAVSVWFGVNEAHQRRLALEAQSLAEAHAASEAAARARAEAINAFVIKALQSSDPLQTGDHHTTIAQAMDNAVREINLGAFANDPPTEAALQETIGLIFKNNARYDSALPLLQDSIATQERLLRERGLADSADLARTLNTLGSLRSVQNQFDQAQPILQRSLDMFERVHGPEHTDVAAGLNALAVTFYLRNDLDRAEPLLTRALAIREKVLPPTHRDLALTLNDLALLHAAQHRSELAEAMMKRALSINEQGLGPNHPDVAASLNSLATMYDEQGRYELAEPLYQRALAICEQALGPEHPLVATGLHNLAYLYRTTGELDLAEPLQRRALAIREKVFGPEHPDVAVALNNLALVWKRQGRLAEAEGLYLRTLAIDEKLYGPEHAEVGTDLHNLGALYEELGQLDRAEQMYARALAIREKTSGVDSVDAATTLNNLALLRITQGKAGEGETLALRAVETYQREMGAQHPQFAAVLLTLARTRTAMGKTTEARIGYDQAVAILRASAGENGSPTLARALMRSADARMQQGDADSLAAAQRELEEAVAIGERTLAADHPQLAEYRERLRACTEAMAGAKDGAKRFNTGGTGPATAPAPTTNQP